MSEKGSFKQRFQYRFDNFMAAGPGAMFLSLGLAFLVSLVFGGLLMLVMNLLVGNEENVGLHSWWISFLELADAGNMAGNEGHVLTKVVTVLDGFLGMIIFATFISFITAQLEQKLDQLKKGKSTVLETGHTLILGWNDNIVEIIRELIVANENYKDKAIVILADKDKEEMDDFLKETLPDLKTTRIITRRGEISEMAALRKVGLQDARSVIILADCNPNASLDEKRLSDAQIVKAVLAITGSGFGTDKPIVTEVFEEENVEILESVTEGAVICLNSKEIISKILVQTSRTTGLAMVYNELLGFVGQEFYPIEFAEIQGRSFGEAIFAFPDSTAVGLVTKDKQVVMNPPAERIIAPGDRVIFLAEDDDTTVHRPGTLARGSRKLPDRPRREPTPERHLLLGWNAKAPTIIKEYADYVPRGSEVAVMLANPPEETKRIMAELDARFENVTIRLLECETINKAALTAAEPFGYDNIIILSRDPDEVGGAEVSDSQTINTLLLLRDIQKKSGKVTDTKLITELFDSRNRELLQIAKVNDFVISNKMVSMIIAQVSEEPDIYDVYKDLFAAEGSEIYLKDIALYLDPLPAKATFAEMIDLSLQRREIAFGYKVKRDENDAAKNFGVVLNPPKKEPIAWETGDCLVVLAEDDR